MVDLGPFSSPRCLSVFSLSPWFLLGFCCSRALALCFLSWLIFLCIDPLFPVLAGVPVVGCLVPVASCMVPVAGYLVFVASLLCFLYGMWAAVWWLFGGNFHGIFSVFCTIFLQQICCLLAFRLLSFNILFGVFWSSIFRNLGGCLAALFFINRRCL
ncbi:hypothetical protein KFK09_022896 [Dendrobium nobile]|uniref:Uncharacterized protein n=1 Tax=Dendrobium nobile TaxID=94219 RepID=A0A8T3AJ33_DENNO|nr:hypothetical protein KFK09_022896 [Dendrobium nobile]